MFVKLNVKVYEIGYISLKFIDERWIQLSLVKINQNVIFYL
jgi:hypothetical protein